MWSADAKQRPNRQCLKKRVRDNGFWELGSVASSALLKSRRKRNDESMWRANVEMQGRKNREPAVFARPHGCCVMLRAALEGGRIVLAETLVALFGRRCTSPFLAQPRLNQNRTGSYRFLTRTLSKLGQSCYVQCMCIKHGE